MWLGIHQETGQEVAIKLELVTESSSHLENEAKFYKLYEKTYGVPQVYYFGQFDNYYALVMDLLGPTLDDMLEFCQYKFSHKTMLMIAIQMLRCL